MTPQQDIFTTLTAVLPVIGVILPGIIKSDGLTDEQNSFITFVILLVCGGLQAWSANQINVNPWLDLVAVEAAMASLIAGPLKPLDLWLQGNIGLITPKSPTVTPTAPPATPQSQPAPPTGSKSV